MDDINHILNDLISVNPSSHAISEFLKKFKDTTLKFY